ncbi:PREDICTED: THAP domain-containing protein 2-like [Trachymyrmex cornetzi]|uniref:THAP domain-containing protein 2-like n=1 Tax=Trachymyrmex cornetzi TaxID=471704 RepID=UPI00084F844E|nr:PREDICTED: THAP domain-containing protein 2-like [Trachymyrmex cornetzi]
MLVTAISSAILQLTDKVFISEQDYSHFVHVSYKMPTTCSAPRCTNSNKNGYCCTMFAQDPKLKQKWIDAAGIPDWKPSKSAVLCEVHFHSSEVFRIGRKKLIRKGAIPILFCKCQQPMKRKSLIEIQPEQQCNESFLPHKKTELRSDHSYVATEKKRYRKQYVINELQEHNYFSLSKKRKLFESRKKYVHTTHCVTMKKPIDINTLETYQ